MHYKQLVIKQSKQKSDWKINKQKKCLPWAVLLFAFLLIYNNYRVTIMSCKKRQSCYTKGENTTRLSMFLFRVHKGVLPDDCVSWEELSCRADGEGTDMRVAALLELRSASRDHVWIPGLLDAPPGLGRLLEDWLDKPLGLGGLLGPSEVPPAPDSVGEGNRGSLRLFVRKLVLVKQWEYVKMRQNTLNLCSFYASKTYSYTSMASLK